MIRIKSVMQRSLMIRIKRIDCLSLCVFIFYDINYYLLLFMHSDKNAVIVSVYLFL